MLLTELRPRGHPSVLLAHDLSKFSRFKSKPLRLSVLHPHQMALIFAMPLFPPPSPRYHNNIYSRRSIKCKPLAVSTTPEMSPGWSANAASSNSFCMSPRPKYPRSPLLRALLQSDSVTARSPREISPLLMRSWWASMIFCASSLLRVMFDCARIRMSALYLLTGLRVVILLVLPSRCDPPTARPRERARCRGDQCGQPIPIEGCKR